MNDDKIKRILVSIGKECFVAYFEYFFNLQLSNKEIAQRLHKEKDYTPKACNSRTSHARSIIKSDKSGEVLNICANSKGISPVIRERALKLRQKYYPKNTSAQIKTGKIELPSNDVTPSNSKGVLMSNQGLEMEEKVKKVLEKEFGKLTKQKIPIGKNRKGKEFDLVSDDRHVVIEVKSYKFDNETTKKSGYASTRKQRLITACAYLDKVDAKRKILVLTDKELCEQFKRDMEIDDLFPTVEIRCVPINSAMPKRPTMSETENIVEDGKMKTNSQLEKGKDKCRKEGLVWIEKRLGQVDKSSIRVSKCYSPEEVPTRRSAWWIEIPLKKLTKHKEMHLLLQCEDKHDEFHHLHINCGDLDRYVKEGDLDVRRVGKEEEVISLHLSADTDDIFQDFRGKGKIDFKKYLQ